MKPYITELKNLNIDDIRFMLEDGKQYIRSPKLDTFLASKAEELYQKGRGESARVEGLSAVIKFIRNKARKNIMKADEYGQGYYQAIKDLEDYFGIKEI